MDSRRFPVKIVACPSTRRNATLGAGKMTVVAVHPDSASLELHMDIGGEEFRKLGHLLRLTGIECYGRPSERALEQLRQKAAALGDGGTVVSIGRFAGFTHITPAMT